MEEKTARVLLLVGCFELSLENLVKLFNGYRESRPFRFICISGTGGREESPRRVSVTCSRSSNGHVQRTYSSNGACT